MAEAAPQSGLRERTVEIFVAGFVETAFRDGLVKRGVDDRSVLGIVSARLRRTLLQGLRAQFALRLARTEAATSTAVDLRLLLFRA